MTTKVLTMLQMHAVLEGTLDQHDARRVPTETATASLVSLMLRARRPTRHEHAAAHLRLWKPCDGERLCGWDQGCHHCS